MSALAKESRLLAEKLENDAKNIRDIAEKAFNTSLAANTIAKDGITKQANIRYIDFLNVKITIILVITIIMRTVVA